MNLDLTSDRIQALFEGVQANGHAVQVCGPQTGHFVRTVAFCESPEHAKALVAAMLFMINAAE